jgi:hypothetical protein
MRVKQNKGTPAWLQQQPIVTLCSVLSFRMLYWAIEVANKNNNPSHGIATCWFVKAYYIRVAFYYSFEI